MASTPNNFSGKITLVACLTAKPGKGDAVRHYFINSHKHANSDAEPGCLTFRMAGYGDSFVIFEEYANRAALEKHFECQPFKDFSAAVPELATAPPNITYFEEFKSE